MNYDIAIARAFVEANVKAMKELERRQNAYEDSLAPEDINKMLIQNQITNMKVVISEILDEIFLGINHTYENVPKEVDRWLIRDIWKSGVLAAMESMRGILAEGMSPPTEAMKDMFTKQHNINRS